MSDEQSDKKHQDWLNTYKKIRKPMPPPDKIIKPKNEEPEKFNWRAKEKKEEEYKSISEQKEQDKETNNE